MLAFPCKKRTSFEIWLPLQLQKEKGEEKITRLYGLSREIYQEVGKKRCCGNEGARIRTRQLFLSSRSHATYQRAQFPSRGERAPRKFRQRRALAACTRVNVRMSQLNFLVSSSSVQFACRTATLVAFHLTILSTKLRPVEDAEKAGRKRNGRRRGEGETEMETRRATDCSNRVYEVPVDRKARGHVARLRRRGGEGVILPCVTRITRAALKSTRRTFYRGQS